MVKTNFVTARHKKRKKILKLAKGYFGSKSTLYKTANEQVMRSLQYAYRDRRQKKRNFRKLWITRINAACLQNDIRYSKFIHGLLLSNIEINRKILSDMAFNEPNMFVNYINLAKNALKQKEVEKQNQQELKDHTKVQELQQQELKDNTQKELKQKETKVNIKEKELKQKETKVNIKEKELKQKETKVNIKEKELKQKEVENPQELQDNTQKELKQKETKVNIKEKELNKKLLPELKKLAQKYKINNFSKLKKSELIELLKKIN
ncbi:50S ribosomal protein L20 [Candidatus Phytoplasma fraxini]|uniref:Large ribosomal subunit protein bL20 n=1 Tax=Ash yellows phytoplasma TaxID=35780 RepID=A0ABZ2UCV3_ASHYP